MATWYLTQITHRQLQKGRMKVITENYLVDALNYTEAEARMIENKNPDLADFNIKAVIKKNISDVFFAPQIDDGVWFQAKVNYITFDDKNGKDKKSAYRMMVFAKGLKEAYDTLHERLGNIGLRYEVADMVTTQVLDVYPYKGKRPDKVKQTQLEFVNH